MKSARFYLRFWSGTQPMNGYFAPDFAGMSNDPEAARVFTADEVANFIHKSLPRLPAHLTPPRFIVAVPEGNAKFLSLTEMQSDKPDDADGQLIYTGPGFG